MLSNIEWYDDDFVKRKECPWCKSNHYNVIYSIGKREDSIECEFGRIIAVKKCNSCGMVYSSEILSSSGKQKYWQNYSSRIHENDEIKNRKRNEMYLIEYNFIMNYIKNKRCSVLDIGCGEGRFLDLFKKNCDCFGVEIGEEASIIASKKHTIYKGEIENLSINRKFDLVVLRGIIQYFDNPYDSFNKITELVDEGGLIYITSSPNSDSILFKIFKEHFSLPVNAVSCNGFNSKILNKLFESKGFSCIANNNLYLGTPYENFENDIQTISKAIELKKQGIDINFKAPAFFDNILSLVYRKETR